MKTLSSYKQFAKHILFEAKEFKAKSKKTGRVVVYKSKDAMDAAIKGGSSEPLDKKKATKQDVDSDMFAQDTWDRHGYDSGVGDEDPPSDDEMDVGEPEGGEFMGHDPDDIDDLSPDAILGKDEEPPGKSSGIDDDPFDNLDNMFGDEDEDDLEDPAGGRGDAWMHGDDEKDEPWRYGPFDVVKDKDGEDMFVEPEKKPKKKRPGGKEAEAAYHQADRMMKKYAGVDIKRAEYWAKEKKKAADAMLPEHSFAEMFKRMENR